MAQHRGPYAHGHTGSASTLDLVSWPSVRPSSRNVPAGLFGSHGPTWPSLAADWHALVDRGVRRHTLARVVFLITGGDKGGFNVERRMQGVRKRGPRTPSLDVDGRQ
jgi:hypothetical protein